MTNPREQYIAKMEGREYVPESNNDSLPTAINSSDIDNFYLESFDAWVRTNRIDTVRLFGLLRSRK